MKKVFEKKEVFVFVILCILVLTPIASASIFGEIVSVWESAIDLIKELFGFGDVNEGSDGELGSLGAFGDEDSDSRIGILSVLDDVPNAYAAYGLRRLSDSYNGPLVEVRRDSDDEVSDIGFNVSGDLDISGLESFCSLTDCYVETWYDQVGDADMNQSNEGLQPIIVRSGKVILDEEGFPKLEFIDSILSASGTSISNHNLTAFFVQQSVYDRDVKVLLGLGSRKFNTHLMYYVLDGTGSVHLGDGSSWDGLGDVRGSMNPFLRTIQILESNGQTVRFFRDRMLLDTKTHNMGESVQDSFQVGSYSGLISEVIIYPALSDINRIKVYDNINNYFLTGPINVNTGALLPQNWQWHVDLYDWLENITEADVTTSPGNLSWDGTYSDINELADLWVRMESVKDEYTEFNEIVRADSKWFVLDDGNGAGIEGNGSVRIFKRGTKAGSTAPTAAFYYQQNIPLSGGGQGNPYFNDPAVCRRALTTAFVDMIMADEKQDESLGYWSNVDFGGGHMDGWVWVYDICKDYLDNKTDLAFKEGLAYMTYKLYLWGPHDVNGNMDMKAISGVAHAYNIFDDPRDKALSVKTARKILFGRENGTIESVNQTEDTAGNPDSLYNPAGYIDEGDSPETHYNGDSLFHIMQAYIETKGNSDWDFMDTVARSMVDFKFHNFFTDPDGFRDGPSGYAGRTGSSYVGGGQGKMWKFISAAVSFDEGKVFSSQVVDENTMISNINSALNWVNKRDIGNPNTIDAYIWTGSHLHWPIENLYLPDDGWYPSLKTLIDNNDPLIYPPFERASNINRNFDREFWAYKNKDSERDFGFFIETLEDPGYYSGWYGGSLQTFWTNTTGMIILARHDKAGCSPPSVENTRCWYDPDLGDNLVRGIDSWATHHVWGRDENNNAFSIGASNQHDRITNYNNQDTSVSIKSILGNGSTRGQENASTSQIVYPLPINGIVEVTNNFTAISNGLLINHIITSNQSDEIRELWVTLPVFLRDYSGLWGGGNEQTNLEDTTIEYWDVDKWKNLTTDIVNTGRIRLGRDFKLGDGLQYIYIMFDGYRGVRLSYYEWEQVYQGHSSTRNIHIDLHGSTGTNITFPALREITYAITTTPEVGDIVYENIPLGSPPVTSPSSSGSSPGGSSGSSIGDVELTDEEIDDLEGEIGSQLDEGEVSDFSEDDEIVEGFDVEEGKGSSNLIYYIIFGIVGLLVVLVIVYVFFIKRKGGSDGKVLGSDSSSKILKKKEVSRAEGYVDLTSKKLK
ncbi:hypothetical protein GOV12_06255 [Candidatus Pacearchaeota archaeon]|nr:hypothetical protein [Candidatus Pacearchaeota archaeon]